VSTKQVLTNHPGRDKSPTWARLTHFYGTECSTPVPILNRFLRAWGLFRLRSDCKVVVLGGGAQVDLWYMILQRLWPFKQVPIIKIDCLWYRSSGLKHLLKRALFKWLDKVVSYYVVWASREILDYASAFGIPAEKFVFVPYHTTVNLGEVKVEDKGYVFSGGNFARDYESFVEAVAGLDIKVVIACTNSAALKGIRFPRNVTSVSVSHAEFMQLIASSTISVVVLKKGLLHSGGQQTFLNAMAMGKPVIVTDPQGAKDYIDNGVNGVLIPPGNPESLRNTILGLYRNSELRRKLGSAARERAAQLDTEANLSRIARLAENVSSCWNKW